MNLKNKDISIDFAQQKLLGCLLYKNDKIVEVIDKINPETFSIKEYSDIYKCMVSLFQEGKIISDATILERSSIYGYDITPELIKKLANSQAVVTKKEIKNLCEIIANNYLSRSITEQTYKFLEDFSNYMTPNEKINKLMDLTLSLSDNIQAKNHTTEVFVDQNEIMSEIDFRYNDPFTIKGIPFGIQTMDQYSDGACMGDVISIGGESNSGKTYFALQLLINMAKYLYKNKIKKKIVFFSLEMSKKDLYARLISIISGIKNEYIKNPRLYFIENNMPENQDSLEIFKERISKSIKIINMLPIIIDDCAEYTADDIIIQSKKVQLKHGLACVFVDYIGLVDGGEKENWKDIATSIRKFRKAFKNMSPIVSLNQYNNSDIKDKAKSGYKPNIYDVTGGKEVTNATTKMFHVWRPEKHADFIALNPQYKGKLIIINDKMRDGKKDSYMPDLPLNFDNGQLVEGSLSPRESLLQKVFSKEGEE